MKPEYYVYEAAYHCPEHSLARFGAGLEDPDTTDNEGNPISAVFSWETTADDYCDECLAEQIAADIAAEKALGLALHNWHSSGGSGIYNV